MAVMPHILLDEKMTAPYALLPGDPARLDRIAAHLDQVEELAYNREMDPVHIFPINGDKENAVISRHFSTFTVNLVQVKSSKNKGF